MDSRDLPPGPERSWIPAFTQSLSADFCEQREQELNTYLQLLGFSGFCFRLPFFRTSFIKHSVISPKHRFKRESAFPEAGASGPGRGAAGAAAAAAGPAAARAAWEPAGGTQQRPWTAGARGEAPGGHDL